VSSGKSHAKASVALAVPTGVVVWLLTQNAPETILACLGCALGAVLSPDLDVDRKTLSETVLPEPLETLW